MKPIDPSQLPKHFDSKQEEEKWAARWDSSGIYRYDPSRPREETFSVDTPPPTVSGSLHIGHVFSFTHTDVVARYQRMLGRNICYPMGWDDNGLPTERRALRLRKNEAGKPPIFLDNGTAERMSGMSQILTWSLAFGHDQPY